MSDKFAPISIKSIAKWISTELELKKSIFGIPKQMFFVPEKENIFETKVYNQKINTPFGVAAGPHTQMSQNLITAWLCGARFLELKTVQILDKIDVSKPCIDMQDAGYNVEWSQELTIQQSLDEYLKAWIMIHVLHKRLNLPGNIPGVIFNTSIGYNMEGILKPNMQWFIKNMLNSQNKKEEYVKIVSKFFPEINEIEIPNQLSDNITLSTMHGCPPNEIGEIASYLINKYKFHTSIKLNPTALGAKELKYILNEKLGYKNIIVPDIAFEHDVSYEDAITIIKQLKKDSIANNVIFGIKLTNTLEVLNHRDTFTDENKSMYMSGRPLHVITVNLAKKIANEFNGDILISFAGGADCFNVTKLLESGMSTITACSDMLRPGGYTRLKQWLEITKKNMIKISAISIKDFIKKTTQINKYCDFEKKCCDNQKFNCALLNLNHYANDVLNEQLLHKNRFNRKQTKTNRILEDFDCIKAPCTDKCSINQKAYKYIQELEQEEIQKANQTILEDNLIPNILGYACDHECEMACTRNHYDDPIAIREIKRYISSKQSDKFNIINKDNKFYQENLEKNKEINIAIIGSGPCGIATAVYLSLNGYSITIFESKNKITGMINSTIPNYRLDENITKIDYNKFLKLNIKFNFNTTIDENFNLDILKENNFKYIVIAIGAQNNTKLKFLGETDNLENVFDSINFLEQVKYNKIKSLSGDIGIIGAGDVAMDCARTAKRLIEKEDASVSIIYRKTINEMTALKEELDETIKENINIKELLEPQYIESTNNKLTCLICSKMELSNPNEYGKKIIKKSLNETEIRIPLNTLIIAVGQKPNLNFFGKQNIELTKNGFIRINSETMETSVNNIYCGGDVADNGPANIVKAYRDGRKIAESIHFNNNKIKIKAKEENVSTDCNKVTKELYNALMEKRSYREFRVNIPEISIQKRTGFDKIIKTLPDSLALQEIKRCLKCNLLCNTCVTACPNKAIFSYMLDLQNIKIPIIKIENKNITIDEYENFVIKQKYQVAIYTPFCNECGNCSIFCPTNGSPYLQKPRFYNNIKIFNKESNNAYIIYGEEDYKYSLKSRFNGKTLQITINSISMNDYINCVSPNIKFNLNIKNYNADAVEIIKNNNKNYSYSIKHFIKMYFLLISIINNMPELPIPTLKNTN